MKLVKLEDVCYNGSSSLSQKDIIMLEGKYPVYGASGLIKYINFYKYDKEYIAIVKDGAGIGRTMILPANSSVISTLQYIFPKENINIRYLYYALNAMDLSKYYSGVTIPHIYFKDYKKEELYLPIIDEQINIVNKLDKIREIIDIRKKQIEELDEIIKSQFVEMFGDIKSNDKNWKTKNGSELFIFSSGKSNKTSNLSSNFEYKCYGGNGITGLSKDYLIDYDTIVIGRVGAYCGSVHTTEGKVWITDNAIYIKEFKEDYNIKFLKELFEVIDFHRFANFSGQPKITQQPLQNYSYILPPIELQNQFADVVKQIDKQKFEIQKSLEEMQKLQESLMNKYFGEY